MHPLYENVSLKSAFPQEMRIRGEEAVSYSRGTFPEYKSNRGSQPFRFHARTYYHNVDLDEASEAEQIVAHRIRPHTE